MEANYNIEVNKKNKNDFELIYVKGENTYYSNFDVNDYKNMTKVNNNIKPDEIYKKLKAATKRPFEIKEIPNKEQVDIIFNDPSSLLNLELTPYTPINEGEKINFTEQTIEWRDRKYKIKEANHDKHIIYRYKGENNEYSIKTDEISINIAKNEEDFFKSIDEAYYKLEQLIKEKKVSIEEIPGKKVTLTFNFKLHTISLKKMESTPVPIEKIDLLKSFDDLLLLFGEENKEKTNTNKDESTTDISIKSISDSLLQENKYRETNKIKFEDYSYGIKQLAFENEYVDKKIDRCKELLKEIGVPQNRGPAIKDKEVNMKTRIILKKKEFELIDNRLKKNGAKKVEYDLLYRASKDRDRAKIFKEKCGDKKGTLIIVHTKNNKKFGGYTEQTWNGKDERKKDKNAFCFSIDNNRIYEIKNEDTVAIHCSGDEENFGPRFYYMFTLDDKFFLRGGWLDGKDASSFTGQESDYELNGGESNFEVYEVEAFQVKLTK